MEWENLPGEIIEEILFRVPAKSLLQFRSTSKQWNTLLKSRSFAEKHSACARKEESLSIMLIDSRVFLVGIDLYGFHDKCAPSVKVAYQFSLKDPFSNPSQEVDIRNVFHCDGLLLCTTKENRLVVWNPCSGETKWIQLRGSYKESDYYALGYEKRSSCKQYKVLRVDRQELLPINNKYEVYGFASDTWRVLGVATDWFLARYRRGMSVKGNTFWIATQARSPRTGFLLSFDFSTEMFQSLSLPSSPSPYTTWALSVFREEKLFLLGNFCTYDLPSYLHESYTTCWVANSPGPVMSWSQFLTVKVFCQVYIQGSSFLADEQNKAVVFCNQPQEYNKILHIVGRKRNTKVDPLGRDPTINPSSQPLLLNYVPSLAPIKKCTPLGGRKRKGPSM